MLNFIDCFNSFVEISIWFSSSNLMKKIILIDFLTLNHSNIFNIHLIDYDELCFYIFKFVLTFYLGYMHCFMRGITENFNSHTALD